MKKFYFILLSVFVLMSCKEPTHFWNPAGEFPLLENNGSIDKNKGFNLQSVPEKYDIILINFFAPDCKPCIIEVPDLKKIYQTILTKDNIQFVGIGSRLSSLSGEVVADATTVAPEIYKFKTAYKMDYPTYIARTEDLKNFGLTGFPETFILYRNANKKWYVKRKFIGMITEKDVNPFLH